MSDNRLHNQLTAQQFANGYGLVNGVAMHEGNPDRFQIPPSVLKRHVRIGHFVELRIDSPRFSIHENAPVKCTCATCCGETNKPILSHEQPASLVKLPPQNVPSRGWGEDFWVQVTRRDGDYLEGVVDNPLYEARLHEVHQGDTIVFHTDHILAVHASHRQEMVLKMGETDLKELLNWLGSLRE